MMGVFDGMASLTRLDSLGYITVTLRHSPITRIAQAPPADATMMINVI